MDGSSSFCMSGLQEARQSDHVPLRKEPASSCQISTSAIVEVKTTEEGKNNAGEQMVSTNLCDCYGPGPGLVWSMHAGW